MLILMILMAEDTSVGLRESRKIIHFEDITWETSLLTHSPDLWERGSVDLLLDHLFYCVSSNDNI